MATKICKKCGENNSDSLRICGVCGESLNSEYIIRNKEEENQSFKSYESSKYTFCNKCGHKLTDGDLFCPICGNEPGKQMQATTKRYKKFELKEHKVKSLLIIVGIIVFIIFIKGMGNSNKTTSTSIGNTTNNSTNKKSEVRSTSYVDKLSATLTTTGEANCYKLKVKNNGDKTVTYVKINVYGNVYDIDINVPANQTVSKEITTKEQLSARISKVQQYDIKIDEIMDCKIYN